MVDTDSARLKITEVNATVKYKYMITVELIHLFKKIEMDLFNCKFITNYI